jgi:2-amino-4-ketopentanoate thiolase alpha subunit
MIKKGTWIEIEVEVLEPEERSRNLPEETRKTALMMWAKGWALSDCAVGDTVEIETVTGRILTGKVTEKEPGFDHDFGEFVPEIMYIGRQAKAIIKN